jgi:outer membrane lipoprotein LolB
VSEAHLAGPLGVGAQVLRLTPAGLVVNGAPADAAALDALQARVGFELPLRELRYWLLGVPEPGAPVVLERNGMDRAQHLEQAGWNVDFERYMAAVNDWLPQRLVLTHGDVRVRIVIDRWDFGQ